MYPRSAVIGAESGRQFQSPVTKTGFAAAFSDTMPRMISTVCSLFVS